MIRRNIETRWVQVATDLGRALGEVGNYPGARQQYEHILNVSCKTYGSDHPMTIRPYAVTRPLPCNAHLLVNPRAAQTGCSCAA